MQLGNEAFLAEVVDCFLRIPALEVFHFFEADLQVGPTHLHGEVGLGLLTFGLGENDLAVEFAKA